MKKIWHSWDKWECCKYGFYSSFDDLDITKEEAQEKYREFLSDLSRFEQALIGVINEWNFSCEHFLTNTSINRIAWLGQASCAYAMGIPAEARGGFKLLTEQQQKEADSLALKYLKIWENAQKNKSIHKKMERTRLPRGYTR